MRDDAIMKAKAIMRIRQAGNWPQGDLKVMGLEGSCGNIEGPIVQLEGQRGGWVIAKEDILKLARLLEGLEADAESP